MFTYAAVVPGISQVGRRHMRTRLNIAMKRLSLYIHEVSQQSHRSRSTSIRCNLQFRLSEILDTCAVEGFYCQDFFQPFLENTLSTVKTIMSNISRGKLQLPLCSLRGCRYSYGYCGQFSLGILFYRHFQNKNNT